MDFGDLQDVKEWLEYMFDHTLLLDANDPLLETFTELEKKGACALRVWDDVGMEGTAYMAYNKVNAMVTKKTNHRVWITKIEVRENDKNSATYEPGDEPGTHRNE